jgi:two-component system response regulator PhoP
MRILIVEDDQQLRQQIEKALKALNFAIDTAQDGREGLYMINEFPYDLAIIDLGLPEISGIELIKQLRDIGKNFPILILTARSSWQDKVEGLEAGADDYVVKPFHMEEITARINALLRRSGGNSTPKLCFAPLTIDTAAKQASIDGETINLTSYEYNTLEYLAHHAGKVISKTELTDHLYSQDFDRDSNVIEVFIGRLRKKIDPQNTLNAISTVRGQGYQFTLPSTHPEID